MEDNNKLSHRFDEIVQANPKMGLAAKLMIEGNYKEAASILIEQYREGLPEGDINKKPRAPKILEGDEVSQVYEFEEASGLISDGAKFLSVTMKLYKDPELSTGCLQEYFMHVRRHDMGNFADFVLRYEVLSKEENPVYPWRKTDDD